MYQNISGRLNQNTCIWYSVKLYQKTTRTSGTQSLFNSILDNPIQLGSIRSEMRGILKSNE